MASTYTRSDSKFIWMRFKNSEGKWVAHATQYRKDNYGDVRQAELSARDITREERSLKKVKRSDRWVDWVDAWIGDKWGKPEQENTLILYQKYWWDLSKWLFDNGINSPMQMSYKAAIDFRTEKMADGKSNNWTILRLKLMSQIMTESVRRGFTQGNPLVKMGLKADKPKKKPAWSDDTIKLVNREIKKQPQWMRVTFLLGLYQACRMRQCEIPLDDIDLENGRITYWRTISNRPLVKGDKPFTQPIDPRLLPELREIVAARRADGHRSLCDLPTFGCSLAWRSFLNGLKLQGLSQHGLRVTWITRAATSGRNGQRGIFLAEAKRFVNHGSTSVHEGYQRLNADDVSHVPAALPLPALPE